MILEYVSFHCPPSQCHPRPHRAYTYQTIKWFIALGAQLQSLDIFQVDSDRWYNAEFNGAEGSVRAVVGFLRGEKSVPGEEETRKRKRPRTDTAEA
jgi:hypothetical protein